MKGRTPSKPQANRTTAAASAIQGRNREDPSGRAGVGPGVGGGLGHEDLVVRGAVCLSIRQPSSLAWYQPPT